MAVVAFVTVTSFVCDEIVMVGETMKERPYSNCRDACPILNVCSAFLAKANVNVASGMREV